MKTYDQSTFLSMIKQGEHTDLENASLISVDCSNQDLAIQSGNEVDTEAVNCML